MAWLEREKINEGSDATFKQWLVDPDNRNAVLVAMIEMVEGVPFVWPEPNLGETRRKYTVVGKVNLNDPDPWFVVENMATTSARFFKVKVEKLPGN